MISKRRFHLTNPVGKRGEDEATRYLLTLGYRVLERNYRNDSGKALGEIDIVAKDGDMFVFVEVKTRSADATMRTEPLPEQGITRDKLRKLERIGAAYLRERRKTNAPYRFDAILIVLFGPAQAPEIRHFESIFL
ncbi:MAG: YraN family protein [Candidatus Moranbacteria bacterium]|nr:YraN family protein [Candidatus Moranbacteria bacterium]NTW75467.1 YraN family protein [Candidatus Moranbacteria bacterium]